MTLRTTSLLISAAALAVAIDAGADDAIEESPENPAVEIVTSVGSMTVELWPAKAPLTVANFSNGWTKVSTTA